MMFPNWKVNARSELTPNIVRAGIAFEPRQKLIQLKLSHCLPLFFRHRIAEKRASQHA
jgi:hypothetical protein